ncbi:hypothetical protein Leryth_027048 [Lithospermum erythrorhizon]|nr:hypothetical protein Leryth_027048 [Lithospermum erythrorhizon]
MGQEKDRDGEATIIALEHIKKGEEARIPLSEKATIARKTYGLDDDGMMEAAIERLNCYRFQILDGI